MNKQVKTCKFCGEGGFNWTRTSQGWRLCDPKSGALHVCNPSGEQLRKQAIELGMDAAVAASMRLKDLLSWIALQQPTDVKNDTANELKKEPEVAEPETEPAQPAALTSNVIDKPEGVQFVHPNYETSVRYFKAAPRVSQWWAGPAGSGKTTLAKHVAAALGKKPYLISISRNMIEQDLFGYMDANGRYIKGKLYDALQDENHLVLLDECEKGNDGVLVALNAMLEQREVMWPDGTVQMIHPSHLFVAAGNTWGRGADAVYSAAGALDASFLDRFQVKLAHDYDEKFEVHITANRKWTLYVQMVRRAVFDLRLTGVIVGPRKSIAGGEMLNAGIPWAHVERDILWSDIPAELQASIREKAGLLPTAA